MAKLLVVKSGNLTESRRKFLEKAGSTFLLSTLGASFFTSCSTTDDSDPTKTPPVNNGSGITVSGNTITINLSIQTGLNTSGGWLLIENANTLVANVNGAFVALTSVCTHSQCTDKWSFGSNRFTCACHGSAFDPTGKVLNGPASSPLQQFTTQVSSGNLIVSK